MKFGKTLMLILLASSPLIYADDTKTIRLINGPSQDNFIFRSRNLANGTIDVSVDVSTVGSKTANLTKTNNSATLRFISQNQIYQFDCMTRWDVDKKSINFTCDLILVNTAQAHFDDLPILSAE